MSLKNLLVRYTALCKETVTVSNELAKYISQKVKPVIKDIQYSIGTESEAPGIDIICFYSESHHQEDFNEFCYVLENIIPELKDKTRAPYGFYLTYEEQVKIQTIFKNDKYKKDNTL